MIRLAFSIGLAILYVTLSVALGALSPWKYQYGILYWFLVPTVGLTCGGMAIAQLVQRLAPIPWSGQRNFGFTPRRVHLSWRAAIRCPALLPILFFPGYIVSVTWQVGDHKARLVAGAIVAVALIAVALSLRKVHREMRLLRSGAVAMAFIDSRTDTGEEPWEGIRYHFMTANGVAVSGRAYDRGYGVREGSTVPVFYDPKRPRDNIAACTCWLEVDGR